MYLVVRHKTEPFPKREKKRKNDFGEFLNSKYNQDEFYKDIDYDLSNNVHYVKCAHCKDFIDLDNLYNTSDYTYKKIKENFYICRNCYCETCGSYLKDSKKVWVIKGKMHCDYCIKGGGKK